MRNSFPSYLSALDHAVKGAREMVANGADPRDAEMGIEYNLLQRYFVVFTLPRVENRYGFETRCEVVKPTDPLPPESDEEDP